MEQHDVHELATRHIDLSKEKFSRNFFLRNPTVDYLKKCNLELEDLVSLLTVWHWFDFSCGKYLIGVWVSGLYDLNKHYTHSDDGLMLVHFICKYGGVQLIEYILNIYIERHLDLECETEKGWTPLQLLCVHNTPQARKYTLDICIEKNWNLARVNAQGWTTFTLLCRFGTEQEIRRIINVYIERGYDLEQKNKYNSNPLHIVCRYCCLSIIKLMIDVYVEKKLSFQRIENLTIEQLLGFNTNLKNKSIQMYLNCLEKDVFV